MTHGLYLVALLISILCIALIDVRWHLVWWNDWRHAMRTNVMGMALFIAWDIAGIVLSIFSIGNSPFVTGIRIGQFPLEEFFFLFLFVYLTLIAWEGAVRWRQR